MREGGGSKQWQSAVQRGGRRSCPRRLVPRQITAAPSSAAPAALNASRGPASTTHGRRGAPTGEPHHRAPAASPPPPTSSQALDARSVEYLIGFLCVRGCVRVPAGI